MPNRRKKQQEERIIKLQNKTNEGLFVALDNVDRDYNKIQSVHRITDANESAIYDKIGYHPQPKPKPISSSTKPKPVVDVRPVQAEDLEDLDQPVIIPSDDTNTNNIKKSRKIDVLTNSGVS